MTYQEFRKTYAALLRKWPDASVLFSYAEKQTSVKDGEDIGVLELRRYKKTSGGKWKLKEEETRESVTALHYLNAFDPGWAIFARRELNYTRSTKYGRLPYKVISISPDGSEKSERIMIFK